MNTSPRPVPPPAPEAIREVLRQVIDPEVGIDIVDLGLVYRIDTTDGIVVEMTMTSPTCPMGEMILDDVRARLAIAFPGTFPADVRLVWEPPWDPSMMSAGSRRHFGWSEGDEDADGSRDANPCRTDPPPA